MSQRQRPVDFERLVREHHGAVYRAALRVAGEAQAAEDAAQQVYLALVEGRLDLRGSRDERAVLRWWAVRAALAGRRGERHRRIREEERSMPQRDEDPAEEAARRDERGTLERLVAALPEELRLAVRLRFEEGLTYARVGEALAVSEPVAHERVRRALETLRARLRSVGLLALAGELEPRLADPAPAPIPPGLAERLIPLGAATGAASSWTLVVGGACAAALLAGGAWLVLRPAARAGDERVEVAAPEAPDETPVHPRTVAETTRSAVPQPGRPDELDAIAHEPAQSLHAWIHGRVVDANGAAVAGALVTAASVERTGKLPRELVQGATVADGSYELELPVLSADGTSWTLSAMHQGGTARRADPLRAPANVRTEAGVLALGGASDAHPGPWTLTLRSVDPSGVPVAGAVVRVVSSMPSDAAARPGRQEARGVTDGSGWVELSGNVRGGKHVHVVARSQGWQPAEFEVALTGAHTRLVTLEPGLEIHGRLVDAAGQPLEPVTHMGGRDPQVYASARDVNDWIEAAHEPGGRFRIIGLAPEPHRVFLQSPTFSPIRVEGVMPGGPELEIAVKRRDEPLDVGPHCAEVHGVLVDARSGELVAADPDAVEAAWLPADAGLDFERDLRPNLLWPQPRQTAMFGDPPAPRADFHLVGLREGRYVAAARVHGFAPALSAPLALEPHALVTGLELRLQQPARIEGVVLDLDGSPLPGAWVLLTGEGPHSAGLVAQLDADVRETDGRPGAWSANRVKADAQGRFAFRDVPPDLVCTLVTLHPRREPAAVHGCRPGSEVPLRFAAPRTR